MKITTQPIQNNPYQAAEKEASTSKRVLVVGIIALAALSVLGIFLSNGNKETHHLRRLSSFSIADEGASRDLILTSLGNDAFYLYFMAYYCPWNHYFCRMAHNELEAFKGTTVDLVPGREFPSLNWHTMPDMQFIHGWYPKDKPCEKRNWEIVCAQIPSPWHNSDTIREIERLFPNAIEPNEQYSLKLVCFQTYALPIEKKMRNNREDSCKYNEKPLPKSEWVLKSFDPYAASIKSWP